MNPRNAASWAPAVLWAAAIFYLSSLPNLGTGWTWDLPLRKVAHMVEYGVLALLLRYPVARTWPRLSTVRQAALVLGLCIFYATTDEVHQAFVPGRGPSGVDVLIDAAGAALFLLVSLRPWRRGAV